MLIALIVMSFGVIAFIVFMERAQRRLLITYPKRQQGNRVYEGQTSFLPLKLNTVRRHSADLRLVAAAAADHDRQFLARMAARVASLASCPPISAMAARSISSSMSRLIMFFAFFYTPMVFDPVETAENLKKHGGFIPGVRPGERTAQFIDYVLTRITVLARALSRASSASYPKCSFPLSRFRFISEARLC